MSLKEYLTELRECTITFLLTFSPHQTALASKICNFYP